MKQGVFGGMDAWYRPGTSDEDALREVLERKAYRRVRDRFDVQPGERWLDLGANIGAFALYCASRGATAVCYEPMRDCFEVLERNLRAGSQAHQRAVTVGTGDYVRFFTSKNPVNHWRGTVVPVVGYEQVGYDVPNHCATFLQAESYNGVKMDIEGSEGPLIDYWMLPACSKLVMEYHTSRNPYLIPLRHRVAILEKKFRHVHISNSMRKAIENKALDLYQPKFDELIFCWEPK